MDLSKLLVKKRVTKSNLTRLKDKITSEIETADPFKIEMFKKKLSSVTVEIAFIFDNIYILCDEKDIDTYVDEFQLTQNILDELYLVLERSSKENNDARNNTNSNSSSEIRSQFTEVKLPQLSLPTFIGNVEEWLTFSDLFKASVHNNFNLSDAQKLQYLRSSCKGDALKIIHGIPITDANYKIAWDLLEDRYSNKRELVTTIIKKLLSQPHTADSPNSLLQLVDITNECIRSLKVVDQNVEGFADTLVTHLLVEKLDKNTRIWYERQLKDDELGTINGLLSFLKEHARTLQNSKTSFKEFKKPSSKVTSLLSETNIQCPYCNKNHNVWNCDQFLKLSIIKRYEFVKCNKLCLNCLSSMHSVKACKSASKCKTCHRRHNSLLHFSNSKDTVSQIVTNSESSDLSVHARVFTPQNLVDPSANCDQINSNFVSNRYVNQEVLLCTALIRVRNSAGNFMNCRALLDSGSQANFITENCIEKLGLTRKSASIQISCLGSNASQTNGELEITFSPHFCSEPSLTTSVFVIDKVCGHLPHKSLPSSIVHSFNDLVLADPKFFKSAPVDILLGVNVFMEMVVGEPIRRNEELPSAVRSKLGWIISGTALFGSDVCSYVTLNNIELNTEELVQRFWALETVPEKTALSKSELKCEQHFEITHGRDSTGRYVVRLPFKEPPSKLGNSRDLALKRFVLLENKLVKNPELYNLYKDFLNEYLNLGHMKRVTESEPTPSLVNYLPHHPVLRPSSKTTKLRVVFDASAKTSRQCSLNDLLLVGPTIQPDLIDIIIRFRLHPVVICGDIEKMYRQVRVHPEDTDFQRILWRNDPSEQIQEYKLLTVTYGTSSAPFLATRSLFQLSLDEEKEFPEASIVVKRDFYVDDLLTGASSKTAAKELIRDIDSLLRKGGFVLRKWLSNFPEILEELPSELREDTDQLDIVKDQSRKILGINWHPYSDTFQFKVLHSNISQVTKRSVLSEVARLFDPLGLLAPSVIFAKVFLQELWSCKLGWDEPIKPQKADLWISFYKELNLLSNLKIPRFVVTENFHLLELHAFCDSSEKAYCAAVYVKSYSFEGSKVALLCAKTRVTPLKVQSLPRLELCSALLLASLLKMVMKCLNIPATNCFAWSDSTITLYWIASESRRWLPFVANRVSKIQDHIPDVRWNHVQGKSNPADYATRGLQPSELAECDQWFNGPYWLKDLNVESLVQDPTGTNLDSPEVLKEEKKACVVHFIKIGDDSLFSRYSSWLKLCRIIAYCLRFGNNCLKNSDKRTGFLSVEELNEATYSIVRTVQNFELPEEMSCLQGEKTLKSNSKILSLSPFLDKHGVIRVGGRLRNSNLTEDRKHPLLIPQKHYIAKLIIRHYHETYLHAPPALLLSLIRQKFWIISARSQIRKMVKQCVICCRHRSQVAKQMMADLPSSRITVSRAFHRVGVDYAGPFMIKHKSGRGQKSFKAYVCIFICFTTRAVHLEVVEDLSSKACLETLKRFIARRGKPKEIFSDCGTNFKGASKEIRQAFLLCQKNEQFHAFLTSENVKWHFIPPAAPHFGGLWESAVKSMKYHLRRSIGAAILTYTEFTTLITQIEACMNSRPLFQQSDDPTDLSVLTPGHFLIGTAITALPEENHLELSKPLVDRWKIRQLIFQNFWKRWCREYLSQLQQRNKWKTARENLSLNDLVLIKEDNIPPLQWKLGRIIRLYHGPDNKVRVVDVLTSTGEIKRPIVKICPLPVKHDEH